MAAKKKKKRRERILVGGVAVVMALLIVTASLFVLKVLLRDDAHRRRRQVQQVTLVKPPPPPKIKEKPPEPEIKKKEEIVEPEPVEEQPDEAPETAEDEAPAGDDLGLDADGTAGADGFGLRGKKGGRALIGGGGGSRSLMQRYAWYTAIVQDEIRRRLRQHLEENGGIPEGNLSTLVEVRLDDRGTVVAFSIFGSSGHHKMDDAVEAVLGMARISEPPPEGMPRTMKMKISSKG